MSVGYSETIGGIDNKKNKSEAMKLFRFSCEPLDSDETRGIIEKTSRLISNGYDFREMKRLMG